MNFQTTIDFSLQHLSRPWTELMTVQRIERGHNYDLLEMIFITFTTTIFARKSLR